MSDILRTNDPVIQAVQGGGFTGELIRKYDWSETTIGNFPDWPQSLQSALGICINSNFPIAIYWGKDLVLLYNDAWSPIPGNKHPWALGRTAMEVWPDIWTDIEPQFRKAFSGTPGGSKDALLPMQRHGYTEECYFDFTFTPIFGESGKVEGIFNAVIETTYRVINERRASLLQKLSDAINSVTTTDEVFLRTSTVLDSAQADVAFYCVVDAYGAVKACSTGFPDDLSIWALNENRHAIRHIENIQDLGIQLPATYWPEAPTEAVIVPLKAPDGTITGHLIAGLSARRRYEKEYRSFFESLSTIIAGELNTIRSLDEERKRTEALAQIDKAKTAFFSNISHEFRTPLTLMLGPLESVLEDDGHLTEQQRENLHTSYRNTLRLQKLVNTLLDFSKIEAGRMEAKSQRVDLATLTRDIASTFRSAIEHAGIKYSISVDTASAVAEIDVDMYEKVVLNLISNAFKYTTDGQIEIRLRNIEKNIVLSVADTGVGISSDDLPRIFERFYRANNTKGRSQEGTGIGLSMVKELIHLMDGEIQVQSEIGKGTVFTVTLPAIETPLTTAPANATVAENGTNAAFTQEAQTWIDRPKVSQSVNGSSRGKSLKVLIADDNRDMREYVSRLLESDFQVLAASNGEEAINTAVSENPDLILSDIMMPVLDGFGLLKKLKSTFKTRNIPVIFLSARAGEEAKVDGLEAGADDYLVKPFSTKELLARVSNHIAISRARRESEKQFFNLFLQSPAHIHIMRGPNHVFEFFHPLAKEFTGRDLTGISIREFAPQLESQGYFAMLDQVYHEGKSFYLPESKALLRKENGELQEFYFNITYLPWKDVDGKILGVLQFSFDVSAQVKATMQIRESEERFRLLANSIPQIIWITSPLGVPEYVSDQWKIYTGQPASPGMSNLNDYIHPDDLQEVMEKWQEAIISRKAWQVEYRLRNSAGEYKWFHGHTLPLTNEEGEVARWIGSASDIHDQKTANEQLESAVAERTKELIALNNLLQSRNEELTQAKSFLQTVLDSSVELISAFNTDLRYTFVNKRVKELIREPGDLLGKHVLDVNPGFEKTDGYQMLQRALKGETIHIDNRRPSANDKLVLETFVTPLRSAGKIVGVLTMHRDITKLVTLTEELRNANKELLRSNEDLQQFAHVTSHDLREPVRKIKMYENLLRTNFGGALPDKAQLYLDKIEHAAKRITSMIESVLQYSSIGAVQYNSEPIDLNEIIDEIKEDLEIPIRNTNAIIKCDNLPVIHGARPLIFQMFYNILNNSLKFIRNDIQPVVEVKINPTGLAGERLEDFYRIDVSDNGIGFDQSSAERIFDSFHRLNAKDKFEGTGLGLALCKRIAERHHGFLKAFGKLNEGATFSVFIPRG